MYYPSIVLPDGVFPKTSEKSLESYTIVLCDPKIVTSKKNGHKKMLGQNGLL